MNPMSLYLNLALSRRVITYSRLFETILLCDLNLCSCICYTYKGIGVHSLKNILGVTVLIELLE